MPEPVLPIESQQCHSRFKEGVTTKGRCYHKANLKMKYTKKRNDTNINFISSKEYQASEI